MQEAGVGERAAADLLVAGDRDESRQPRPKSRLGPASTARWCWRPKRKSG